MKLLFLSKRRPQGKDLMTRPYGRFFYLPSLLAALGHECILLLLSYNRDVTEERTQGGVLMISESLLPRGPSSYINRANLLARDWKPDWIIGFSDIYYGLLAERLERQYGITSTIDAYDNYESYLPWLGPLHILWRRALGRATLVTAAGPNLADLMGGFRPEDAVHVIPMAADPTGFSPLDRNDCRRLLNLDLNKKFIGYCGAIHSSRDVTTIFKAYEELHKHDDSLGLILTGRKQRVLSAKLRSA